MGLGLAQGLPREAPPDLLTLSPKRQRLGLQQEGWRAN